MVWFYAILGFRGFVFVTSGDYLDLLWLLFFTYFIYIIQQRKKTLKTRYNFSLALKAITIFILIIILVLPSGCFYAILYAKLRLHQLEQKSQLTSDTPYKTIRLSPQAFSKLASCDEICIEGQWYDITSVVKGTHFIELKAVQDIWETAFKLKLQQWLCSQDDEGLIAIAFWITHVVYECHTYSIIQAKWAIRLLGYSNFISCLKSGFTYGTFQPPDTGLI